MAIGHGGKDALFDLLTELDLNEISSRLSQVRPDLDDAFDVLRSLLAELCDRARHRRGTDIASMH